jgi:hypothetical protein
LNRLLLIGTILVFVCQARTAGSAVVVLNTASGVPGELPSDWQINLNHGRPDLSVCNQGQGGEPCLHLKSVGSSFAGPRIVTCLWDSTAPKGAMQSSSEISLLHIFAVVCQSCAAEANRWVAGNHNVAADHQRAYGKTAPHVKGLRLQINSPHTGTVAERYFGEVAFRSALL